MIKESTTKNTFNDRLNIITICKGIFLSYLFTVPLFLIFSFILTYSDFPDKYVTPVVIVVTVLSIFLAGAFATKRMNSKGWLNGAVVGLLYMLVLYLVSSFVSVNFTIDKKIVSMLLIGILSGAIGGIIGINLKFKTKKKFKLKR